MQHNGDGSHKLRVNGVCKTVLTVTPESHHVSPSQANIVLSFLNDCLNSIKFSRGKDTRTYGRISLLPAKEIWQI